MEVVLRGHEGDVWSASFSPDGRRVVTASEDGTARVWAADGVGGAVVLRGHEGSVNDASFSPDGGWVVTASQDGTARIWPVGISQQLALLKTTACLLPALRQTYLGEDQPTALANWERCERHWGRTPVLPVGIERSRVEATTP